MPGNFLGAKGVIKRLLLLALIFFVWTSALFAQGAGAGATGSVGSGAGAATGPGAAAVEAGAAASAAEEKQAPDKLKIYIAVVGPGNELYFWWGHLGLIIEDDTTGQSAFIDYGVFSFNNKDFFKNFAFGLLLYTTTASPTSDVISRYKSDNRSVALYELNLTDEQKEEILRITQHNLLPENRDYLYNHFTRNCVTPVTDTLDEALGGQFYGKASQTPGRWTLRQEIRRFMPEHPFWDLLLNFWMGRGIDKKVSVKEELFLPDEVGNYLKNFYWTDSNGTPHKLVSNIDEVYTAKGRAPILDAPRSIALPSLLAGLLIAVLLLYLRIARGGGLVKQRLFGLCNALLGAFIGVIGSLLFFMEFFTNHDYTYHNINVLYANPLAFIAPAAALIYIFTKNQRRLRTCANVLSCVWTYIFITALAALALNVLPGYRQDNIAQLAIILPVSFALTPFPMMLIQKMHKQNTPEQKKTGQKRKMS